MKNIRNSSILVVEDDASLLCAIEKVLSNEGCVVACASWAAEAMEQLADPQKRFDLIITDLQMPFVKGSTILRMIAQRSKSAADWPMSAAEGRAALQGTKAVFPNVPIIVLTAFGSPEVKTECFRQGAAAFLEKPLDTQQLLTAVEGVLRRKRWSGEQSQRGRRGFFGE